MSLVATERSGIRNFRWNQRGNYSIGRDGGVSQRAARIADSDFDFRPGPIQLGPGRRGERHTGQIERGIQLQIRLVYRHLEQGTAPVFGNGLQHGRGMRRKNQVDAVRWRLSLRGGRNGIRNGERWAEERLLAAHMTTD